MTDSHCRVPLLPSQSGSPQQGVCHVLKWVCQPQPPCDLWLFRFPAPAPLTARGYLWLLLLLTWRELWAASAHMLPSVSGRALGLALGCPQCYWVSSLFTSASDCCLQTNPNHLWSQAGKYVWISFLSHLRSKDFCHQNLSGTTKNTLMSVFFSSN